MRIGDLVKTAPKGYIGIVVEGYDIPKDLWRVYWLNGMGKGSIGLCSAHSVEVIND